jgi:hypothetical protein
MCLGLEVDGETPLGADADLQMDTTILELVGLHSWGRVPVLSARE